MKTFLAIAVLFAVLIAYGCVLPNGNATACTADAKICPDGSAVGRQGPNCEFAPCPPVMVGNDSDSHGCKASAGYSWCDLKQKCLRAWEENCTDATLPRACTEEAKICPDGSAVGRQGPNCEFAPCPPSTYTPPANYTIYGKITLAPLCPVEPCSRTFDYSAVRVNVYDAASKNRIAEVNADSRGYYGINLAQGNYLMNVTDADGNSFGMPRLDYTQSISIEKGHMYEMDFDIDTGIR